MRSFVIILFSTVLFCSCNKDFKSEEDTPIGVFNAMWKFIDKNYVFIDFKNLNMEALKNSYSNQITEDMTEAELFEVCSNFLLQLRDGHCFLDDGNSTVRFDTSEGISDTFNLEVIRGNYLQDNIIEYEFMTTATINDSIGYIYLSDFENIEDIEQAIKDFNLISDDIAKIIFDIRDNSGGDPQVALSIASHFMQADILVGQMVHKNGPMHDDFTDPVDIFSEDSDSKFLKEVRLLTNKNSFSASSFLAGMLQHQENVQIIGEITGGGGGDAISLELPNNWVVAVTINYFLDALGVHIEDGVIPDIFITNSMVPPDSGIDRILEEAIKR